MNTTISQIYLAIFKEFLFLIEDDDIKTLKEMLNLMIESLEKYIDEYKEM